MDVDPSIAFRVNTVLFKNSHNSFRALVNYLVDNNIFSEEEINQLHSQISLVFRQFQEGSQLQQRQPIQQNSHAPKNSLPQSTPSSPTNVASSPLREGPYREVRSDSELEELKAALKDLDVDFSRDPLDAHLYPSEHHGSIHIKMMRSRVAQSYIRDDTLKRYHISWSGATVCLRWSSWSIDGYPDQVIRPYCFHVVDAAEALAAGMTYEILIGTLDGEVPFDQNQYLRVERKSPDAASTSQLDHTSDQNLDFDESDDCDNGTSSHYSAVVFSTSKEGRRALKQFLGCREADLRASGSRKRQLSRSDEVEVIEESSSGKRSRLH